MPPIFILGILPRSGTNYLSALIGLHPAVATPDPIREDWLLAEAHHLTTYAQIIHRHWTKDPRWGVSDTIEPEFNRALGCGLLSFLNDHTNGKRLLTKTPSVQNLPHFFTLFPEAYLLILVRDGRDVVESAFRSFGWNRDRVTRQWAQAARIILDFEESRPQYNYLLIKYEDLVEQRDEEVAKILTFLDLDITAYDFQASANLKVFGSSTFHGQAQTVNWQGVPKTEEFNPVQRWAAWSRARHERYNWLAGEPSRLLGYNLQTYPGQTLIWQLYNRLQDTINYKQLK